MCCNGISGFALFVLQVVSRYVLSQPGVAEKDPPDLLNKRKCQEYLAALRHAKWFQVNASRVFKILSSIFPVSLQFTKCSLNKRAWKGMGIDTPRLRTMALDQLYLISL